MPIIDLNQLPAPDVVEELDFETILAERKATLISLYPEDQQEAVARTLTLESEPLVKLLEENAYRELIWRQRVNEAARAVMLACAAGNDLDVIGANYNTTRLIITPADDSTIPPTPAVMESDTDYRLRIQQAFEGLSVAGSVGAYQYHGRSADGRVADISVTSPSPACVTISVLSRENNGVASEDLLAVVRNALNGEDVRPVHDNNIRGSMAGTGSSAVVTRLQAPTGKAWDALKELGVKTSDKKGNMRPLFTILKEIQASFDKHKLGTSQKGEYLKTIFGEEALKSANVLLAAAASGKLDTLTATLKASDGKTEELVKIMQDNLGGDFKEFQSAYEAVGTDLFDQQEGALRKLTQTATKYVLKLDGWIQKNKSLASTIGLIVGGALALIGIIGAIGLVAWPVITGINAIIAAAGAMGAIFTTVGSAVMTAIGAISWPVVAVVAAIVAGALLIRKYWEPVSAFFGGVVEGLKAAFAPVGELFTPLKPVFDWLGEKLQAAWQWFKNLIAPVKATQDTLNRCRDTGVMFGQALADALMLPLNAFNKLRSGIDWVLEKLGVINKESDTLDQTAARTHAATYGTGGYIPATSSYAGYQAYQPVTAPAGRSYVDQSKNEYHISLTGGTAPGTQLDRQLQDALEKYERDKRARARASMMHDG
ncbi:TPA: phage tail tape measure protein [Escherichia coli]